MARIPNPSVYAAFCRTRERLPAMPSAGAGLRARRLLSVAAEVGTCKTLTRNVWNDMAQVRAQ